MGTRLGTVLGTTLGTVLGTDLGGGGAAPVPPAPIYYVNSISGSNHYDGAASSGEPGSIGGFFAGALWCPESQAVANQNRALLVKMATGGLGYSIYAGGTNSIVTVLISNGAGGFITSAQYTIPPSAVGLWMHVMFVVTGTQLYFYVNGVQIGLPTALTAYSPAPAAATVIGRRFDGANGANTRVAGAFAGTGVPTAAAIAAHAFACEAAGDVIDTMSGVTMTQVQSVKRDQALPAPATLFDKVGSANMSKVGSPLQGNEAAPTWLGPVGPIDVWLCLGDSTMAGINALVSPPAGYPPVDRKCYCVRSDDLVVRELIEPTRGVSGGTSPCGFFAWRRNLANGRNIMVVNGGVPGSNSTAFLAGQSQRIAAMAQLAVALSFPNTVFAGFMLSDGSNDALGGLTTWGSNWTTAEAEIRAEIGAPATGKPFLYTLIRTIMPGWSPTTLSQVRADQIAFNGGLHYMITVPDSLPTSDGLHPTSAGADIMAQLYLAVAP